MIRYYDTVSKTETHKKSDSTILSDDPRVAHFFKPIPYGHKIEFDENNFPIIAEIPEPTEEEIAAKEQRKANSEAIAYLYDTDWYVVRKEETGKPIPQDVLDKRSIMRSKVMAQNDN
jgi:hypothetical protein